MNTCRRSTDSGRFSGTVLLARDGKTLFVKGYGFANEESRLPNSAATRFPIASIAKPFTATLVLQQQKRGALSIADPVCKHLKPCPDAWKDITLRHLLMHTSGIPNYAERPDFLTQDAHAAHDGRSHRDLSRSAAAVRAGSEVSLQQFGLLRARRRSRERQRQDVTQALLEESIFKPLGMNDSGYDNQCAANCRTLAIGYRAAWRGRTRSRTMWIRRGSMPRAASIQRSRTWHKFELALSTDVLLPRGELAGMWSPELGEYGYGWQLLPPSPKTLNRRLVFHAGGIPGYSTDLLRYPDEDVTVIILANLHPVALAEVSRDLSAIVFGEDYSVPPVRRAAQDRSRGLRRLRGPLRDQPVV